MLLQRAHTFVMLSRRWEAWYTRCVHPEGLPFRDTMQMLVAHKLGLNVSPPTARVAVV